MITLFDLLKLYNVEPKTVKLVRHSDREIPILKVFREDVEKLETYQRFQEPNKFGKAKSIIVFAPYYNTTALLLGMWDLKGATDFSLYDEKTVKLLKKHDLPVEWMENTVKYGILKNPIIDELSERLVIEWGRATVSWVQSRDKKIVEIKAKNTISEFEAYNLVELDYSQLQQLIKYPGTNQTWVKALSSVNGIYLIQDKSSGKLYVGSAYGASGIFGRWSEYAKNGHGGNQELIGLNPSNFKFSILEIVSPTYTADDVIAIENRWKEKLGTRQFGLNNN